MRRNLFLLSVSVLPVAVATFGAMSSIPIASAEHATHLLRASSTQTAGELYDVDFTTGACTHEEPTTGLCQIPFFEADSLTGDLVGQSQQSGGLSVTWPAVIGQAVGIATFSGTVKGCPGPGTAQFRSVFTMGVNGQSGTNAGTIDVVPGSGTGGLAGLKGHGDAQGQVTPSGVVVGTFRLDFSCSSDREG